MKVAAWGAGALALFAHKGPPLAGIVIPKPPPRPHAVLEV